MSSINIPTVFKNSMCKCGFHLEEENMKEIGVDICDNIFFMRFKCPSCDLDGKIRFSKFKKTVSELCREIVGEEILETNNMAEKMLELYKDNIACLHIPNWTSESSDEYMRAIDNLK